MWEQSKNLIKLLYYFAFDLVTMVENLKWDDRIDKEFLVRDGR